MSDSHSTGEFSAESASSPIRPDPWVYQNGEWVPQSQAHIRLNDAGFVQGATITDMIRTFGGVPFLCAEHVGRFHLGCLRSGISFPKGVTPQSLTRVVEEVVTKNRSLYGPDEEFAVVLLATPGPVGFYLGEPGGFGDGEPSLIVHGFPVPRKRYAGWFRDGAKLRLVETRQVPGVCVPEGLKTRSRMHWWLAERQARAQEPGSIALLQHIDGQITETAPANVLFIKNGICKSPPMAHILPGVTLGRVKRMILQLGIEFQEGPIYPPEAIEAEEILLTGTMFGIAGVGSLDGRRLKWPGQIYPKLLRMWEVEVGVNLSQWFQQSW